MCCNLHFDTKNRSFESSKIRLLVYNRRNHLYGALVNDHRSYSTFCQILKCDRRGKTVKWQEKCSIIFFVYQYFILSMWSCIQSIIKVRLTYTYKYFFSQCDKNVSEGKVSMTSISTEYKIRKTQLCLFALMYHRTVKVTGLTWLLSVDNEKQAFFAVPGVDFTRTTFLRDLISSSEFQRTISNDSMNYMCYVRYLYLHVIYIWRDKPTR